MCFHEILESKYIVMILYYLVGHFGIKAFHMLKKKKK